MYQIKAKNLVEIRMGSPFNSAELEISGEFIPDFENYSFQDKFAISEDGNACVLVQWDTKLNQPGFVLWKVDGKSRKIIKSKRIFGCCKDLLITNNKTVVTVWSYNDKTKSEELLQVEVQFS